MLDASLTYVWPTNAFNANTKIFEENQKLLHVENLPYI